MMTASLRLNGMVTPLTVKVVAPAAALGAVVAASVASGAAVASGAVVGSAAEVSLMTGGLMTSAVAAGAAGACAAGAWHAAIKTAARVTNESSPVRFEDICRFLLKSENSIQITRRGYRPFR